MSAERSAISVSGPDERDFMPKDLIQLISIQISSRHLRTYQITQGMWVRIKSLEQDRKEH